MSAASISYCVTASITLLVFFATAAFSVWLFIVIPKGFFPQQDTGLITGISEAAQDVSFAKMQKLQEKLGAVVQRDPDVASVAMAIGGTRKCPQYRTDVHNAEAPR